MDKKLKVSEIAARTGLSVSTVSRVLAGKANTSARARQRVLECARQLGVMEGICPGGSASTSRAADARPAAAPVQ